MKAKLDEGSPLGGNSRKIDLPEGVVDFIRRVIRSEKFHPGPERRGHLRYPLTLPVKVTPLDENQLPTSDPFLAVTRDLSISGLCMYHLQSVQNRYLQLELISPAQERLNVVLEVVRCRAAGPFYEIGGQFVGQPRLL
jgi:hypothetical protein